MMIVLTSKTVLLLPCFLVVDIRLGPVILLEQSSPGRHVDIHLLWPWHLPLLSEDLSLSSQLWLPSDQRVEELDLGEFIWYGMTFSFIVIFTSAKSIP